MSETTAGVFVEDTLDESDSLLQAQRWILALVVVIAGLAAGPWFADRYSLPRATAFTAAVVLLATCSILRAVQRNRVVLPASWVLAPMTVFLAALFISTTGSEHAFRSVIGPYARYTGVAMYVVYVALFVSVLRFHRPSTLAQLARVSTVVLGIVAGYGLLQFADLDPVAWPEGVAGSGFDLPIEFATFGNVNFASGFVGVLAPLAVWACLSGIGAVWHRQAAGAIAIASALYLALNGSGQGILAYGAGVAAIGAVWLLERGRSAMFGNRRRAILVAVGVFTGAAVVAPVAGVFARRQIDDAGAQERRHLWSTAVDLWADRPFLGHGMGSFDWLFTPNRPESHAVQNNFLQADAPHNVVLELAVSGGVVLAGAYLAFVLFVGVALFGGLRRLRGDRRLLLAGFGGAWIGYQVQSMVSIDVPPVAVLHWLSAGAVVVLARPPRAAAIGKSLQMNGGAANRRKSDRRRNARGRGPASRRRLGWEPITAVAAVALTAMWPLIWLLRADQASLKAAEAIARGDVVAELEHAERAVALAPWEPRYWAQKAAALDRSGDLVNARVAGIEAASRASGTSIYALAVAGLAVRLEDPQQAEWWLREALSRDPYNPEVQRAVADTRDLLANSVAE